MGGVLIVYFFHVMIIKMPRRNLFNCERLKLIQNIENGKLLKKEAQKAYQVSRATVFRCLKAKENIIEAVTSGCGKKKR